MAPVCINLRERFGAEYRIGRDPASAANGNADPWTMTLPCRFGTIYPHGGTRLAVEIDGRPVRARRLAAISGVMSHQDGDREKTFLFDVGLFEQVAAIVQPRRRRRLTTEQKARLAEAAAPYRFVKGASPLPSDVARGQNRRAGRKSGDGPPAAPDAIPGAFPSVSPAPGASGITGTTGRGGGMQP